MSLVSSQSDVMVWVFGFSCFISCDVTLPKIETQPFHLTPPQSLPLPYVMFRS